MRHSHLTCDWPLWLILITKRLAKQGIIDYVASEALAIDAIVEAERQLDLDLQWFFSSHI